MRQTRRGKSIFGSAFGCKLSVGRCLIFELCLDLWIALVSSHALKGKRVIQILGNQLHFGGCRPGLLAQSSACEAVSACRARLSRSVCSEPGARLAAFSRISSANIASRFCGGVSCLKRRLCMTLLLFAWGGSATGVLITDKSHGWCGDIRSVSGEQREGES